MAKVRVAPRGSSWGRALVLALSLVTGAAITATVVSALYFRKYRIVCQEQLTRAEELQAAAAAAVYRVQELSDRLAGAPGVANAPAALAAQLADMREDLLLARLAYRVEEITEQAGTIGEKCVMLARWVAGNISNREDPAGDALEAFARRAGVCGQRSALFLKMVELLNVPAGMFNLYNFGGPASGGHSCVQVFFDDGWHFFDVTYAGMFVKSGKVLSWDEIKADPDGAHACMVVFPETRDRLVQGRPRGTRPDDAETYRPVDNTSRMSSIYTPKNIREVRTYGFQYSSNPKLLYPVVDLENEKLPLVLGALDGNRQDVLTDGMRKNVSMYLDVLGTSHDTLHTCWELKNARPGREYSLIYKCLPPGVAGMAFWAKGEACELVSGATFSPVYGKRELQTWEVLFRPSNEGACRVLVGYDFRDAGRGVFVDQIVLGEKR